MSKKIETKEEVKPSLKALTLENVKVEKLVPENQEGVLIDGGASSWVKKGLYIKG